MGNFQSLPAQAAEKPPMTKKENSAKIQRDTRKLSVVIPALNEEANLEKSISSVRSNAVAGSPEIIVVDGGSTDKTRDIAQRLGAKVVQSDRGRGPQLKRGAEEATGDVILFLHADSRLPDQYDERILTSTAGAASTSVPSRPTDKKPGPLVWGCFEQLKIADDRPIFRLIERAVHFRTQAFCLPYGDQGIFVTRPLYDQVGGVKPMKLMEDVDLVYRLRAAPGSVRAFIPAPIETNARRWQKNGVIKTTLMNQAILMAYSCGANTDTLEQIYYGFHGRAAPPKEKKNGAAAESHSDAGSSSGPGKAAAH